MTTFKGETGDMAPILGAEFWTKGTKIAGVVVGQFKTQNGICWQIKVLKPIKIKGEVCEVVSVGNMKGFEAALVSSGADMLKNGDKVVIESIGERETGQKSPMILFSVEVDRP